MKLAILFIGFTLCYFASCDIYMHVLRGSNNRLDEPTQNRKNANRIFDSQNNNKGGYNVGDRTNKKAKDTGNTATIVDKNQYNMEFYESVPDGPSRLQLEWTNQHGCGGNEDDNPHKLNCNFVLQYMCQPDVDNIGADTIRNGVNRETVDYQAAKSGETQADFLQRKAAGNKYGAGNSKDSRGMHERFEWYDKCKQRERNKGLFTADQDLRNRHKAINTRQNRNGNRRGYECPEERDYYPYWHPTSWRDVAVFANNASFCDWYKSESFNVAPRHECVEKWSNGQVKHYSEYNNEKQCKEKGGEWLEFHNYLEKATKIKSESACTDAGNIWARPIYGYEKECLVPLTAPHCEAAPWTRVNHLGNSAKGGDMQTPNYMWEIPHFPGVETQRCVFRVRYNISTDDYDPFNTDWTLNGDKGYAFVSNDPKVDIGASNEELQLNINTAQFGRTFQDRSHVFKILNRPAAALKKTIHNIVVRGKRGNIVQTFPAVEYDFSPTDITIKEEDLVHYQWTGSNSHNNGGGGDGQAGDDGEGTGGTDRNNCVPMTEDRGMNFPVLSESELNMFNTATVVHEPESLKKLHPGHTLTPVDVYVQHASSGYYACGVCESAHSLKDKAKTEEGKMDGTLNKATPSYAGILMHLSKGRYNYMCTRNNNFSNRSQKATITVV